MTPLLFALCSYLCWGSGDIFGTISSRKLGAYSSTLWMNVISVLLFSVYIPFAVHDLSGVTWPLFFFSLLLGIFFFGGELAFNEATHSSNASVSGTIASSYTAVTVALSVLFLHESITLREALPIGIILIGLVLCNLDFSELRRGGATLNRGTSLAVVAAVCWGSYFAFLKPIVVHIGPFWPYIYCRAYCGLLSDALCVARFPGVQRSDYEAAEGWYWGDACGNRAASLCGLIILLS